MTHRLALPPPACFGCSFLCFSLIRSPVALACAFSGPGGAVAFAPGNVSCRLGLLDTRAHSWGSLEGGGQRLTAL